MYHLLFRIKITTDTNVLGVMTNISTDIQYDCISILISQTVLIFNDCINLKALSVLNLHQWQPNMRMD